MQTCSSSPMHDSSSAAAAVLLGDAVEHYCTTCQLPCSAISLIAGQHVGHASLPLAHALQHLPTELLREAKELQQVMEEQCIKSHAVMQQQLRTSMEVLMVAHKDAQAALLRAQEDLRMVKERQRELHAATAVADCNYHYQKQKYAQRLLRLARGCQNLTKMGHEDNTLASHETSSHVPHPQHERAHGGEGKKQLLQLEKHLRAEWARLHRDNDAAMDLFHDEVEMCVEQRSSVGDDARSSNNKAVDTMDLSDIDAGGQRHRHHHMDLEDLLHHRTDMMMEQRSSIPTQSASPCADDVLAAPPPTNLQESNSSPWRRMEQQHEELLRQLDLAMHDATHHSTSRSLVHHAEPAWRSAVELLERTPTSESSRSSGSNITDVQRQLMDELTNSLRTSRGLF